MCAQQDVDRFYDELFQPLTERVGPLDPDTLMGVIGFDAGGPVSLRTIGAGVSRFVTYVTCELAVRSDQKLGDGVPYELTMTCDDEDFARSVLTKVADLGIEVALDSGHTIDMGGVVGEASPVRGVVLDEFARVTVDGGDARILHVIGVTPEELAFAQSDGVPTLLARHSLAGTGWETRSMNRDDARACMLGLLDQADALAAGDIKSGPGTFRDRDRLWNLGEHLRQLFVEWPSLRKDRELQARITKVALQRRAGRGRESFVMLLGYRCCLLQARAVAGELSDPTVEGHVICALYRMRAPGYSAVIQPFDQHRRAWIRKEAARYLAWDRDAPSR